MTTFLKPVEVVDSDVPGMSNIQSGGQTMGRGTKGTFGVLMFAQFVGLAQSVAATAADYELNAKQVMALETDSPATFAGAARSALALDDFTCDIASQASLPADQYCIDGSDLPKAVKSITETFRRIGREQGPYMRQTANILLALRSLVAMLSSQKLWELLGVSLDDNMAVLLMATGAGGLSTGLTAAAPAKV